MKLNPSSSLEIKVVFSSQSLCMIRTIMLYNGVFYRFSPVFWNRYCLRTNIRAYFRTKRGLVFIQLSVIRDKSFFSK